MSFGPGVFLFTEEAMEEKVFKTYEQMLDILKERGIDLSTSELRGRAKRSLQHEGYYRLINGYKMLFLKKRC